MATTEKFRLRNPKVTRVDLVDRGANQDAHIVLAKADTAGKERASGLASRMAAAGSGKKPDPAGPTLPRPKGEKQRIVRIRPEDFEVTEVNGNMMEWAIPEEKLPEGVEEAIMTMAQSGETVMFQWMIDPLAGPPVEGQAKTAAEAFMAMRAALTNQGAMDPTEMLGGFPNEKPMAQPGQNQMLKPSPMAKAVAEVKKKRTATPASPRNPEETLTETLDLITKGLVEVDIFNETATGRDLLDILPENLVEEITSKLSAT